MLTHGNLISNIKTAADLVEFSDKDTVLSFLPLSHVLERMVMFTYIYKGATIAYAESVEAVAENLLEVRPHIMVSVPRLFEKIYAKVMDQVLAESRPEAEDLLLGRSRSGRPTARRRSTGKPVPGGLRLRHAVAAKLVFSKIMAKTGGRVRFFVSGGAPLSKDIAEFFYAIGLVILEGYGLTETSPLLSINTFEAHPASGRSASPIPGVEIRIAADGEILARGPERHEGLLQEGGGDPGGPARAAGSTPATSATSTTTASWSSPTARRTSSSPRAARTSPPSRSRTCSRRAPTSPTPWSSATGGGSSRP